MEKIEELVIRSPWRKHYGGFWLICCAFGALYLWKSGPKTSGIDLLMVVICLLFTGGVYNLLTYTKTQFKIGKSPCAVQTKFYFAIFKKEITVEFDELEILRRDSFMPYCQLYAFQSEENLKNKFSEAEIMDIKDGKTDYPGLIIVDQSTKKECEAFIAKIWEFYGLEKSTKDTD